MNDTTTDLDIPDASMKEIESVTLDATEGLYDGRHERHARRIAAPIVAAELRRLAESTAGYDSSSRILLRARADELDSGKP